MTSFDAEPERRDDPLVESCLEEILGGKTPPDLKRDIIRRMRVGKGASVVPPPFQRDTTETKQPVIQPLTRASHVRAARSRAANRARTNKFAWTMATGAVVGLLVFAIYSANSPDNVALPPTPEVQPDDGVLPEPQPVPEAPTPRLDQPQLAVDDTDVGSEPLVEEVQPQPAEVGPVNVAQNPVEDEQVVGLINKQIEQRWELADIRPTGPIDDETWRRRVFQRLFGRSMTDDELRSFERWQTADKRRDLMDLVFTNESYKDEFATYWGKLWSDRLQARANPRDAKTLQSALARYLKSQFEVNRSHDQWVSSLITAEGSNILSEDDHNGATNFLLGLRDKDGVLPTTEVCRVLLGQRVQCAQCHNDGKAGLDQDQFWEMTAYFRQIEFTGFGRGRGRLSRLATAEPVRFQRDDGEWQQVEPRFFASDTTVATNSQDRRAELAGLITHSGMFARAAVNRVWSHFLGFGFTSPVDDMGHRNPASHPVLLDQLADHFARADFDTQRLIRWIVLSEPFNRSEVLSVSDKADVPEISFVAFFSRSYHRSSLFLTPHDALVSLGDGKADRLASMLSESVFGRKQDSFDEDDESASDDRDAKGVGLAGQLTIGQLRLARSLAKSRMSHEEKLRHVFLSVMARFPTDVEMRKASSIYASAQDNEIQAMENLIWALTRTQEFVNEH